MFLLMQVIEFELVSFHVKSLFSNVSIKQTVDLILRQIYQDRVFKHLKNWTSKKTYLKQMYRNCLLSQKHVLPTKV